MRYTRAYVNRRKTDLQRLTRVRSGLMSKIKKTQAMINKDVKLKRRTYDLLRRNHYTVPKTNKLYARLNRISKLNRSRGKKIKGWKNQLKLKSDNSKIMKQKIRQPRVSSLKSTSKNGFYFRHAIFPLIEISEETIPSLIELVHEKHRRAIERMTDSRQRLKMDDKTVKHIRLVFSDEYSDHISLCNVDNLDEIEQALRHEMNKHNPTGFGYDHSKTKNKGADTNDVVIIDNEELKEQEETKEDAEEKEVGSGTQRFLYAIDFFMYNGGGKVGCSSREKQAVVFSLSHNELIHLYSPKTKDNRCFDMCLIKGKELVNNTKCELKAYHNRQKLKIPTKSKIDPNSNEAHLIADKVGVSYRVYIGLVSGDRITGDGIDKSFKLYCKYGEQDINTLNLLLIGDHCYLIKDDYVYNVKCKKCGDFRKRGIEKDHKCDPIKISFYQTKICENDVVQIRKLRTDNKRNWVFFDLETLPCGKGEVHNVYAVGWYDYQTKKYYVEYGKNSMKKFMNWTAKHSNKTYIAYNGCRFDFYFIQKC